MNGLYSEKIPLTLKQKCACREAMGRIAEDPIDGLAGLLMKGIRAAHRANNVSERAYWRNLFITEGMEIPLKMGSARRAQNCPDNPYGKQDQQLGLKYLYYGRGRKLADGSFLDETDRVLSFFHIPLSLNRQKLDNSYGNWLKKLIDLRNLYVGHLTEDELKGFDWDKLTQYRDAMFAVAEPFCQTQWEGQYDARDLKERIVREFYTSLGAVSYSLPGIMEFAGIREEHRQKASRILVGAGLTVENDRVTLSWNPAELAQELKKLLSRTDLSEEALIALLKSRMPEYEDQVYTLLAEKDKKTTELSQQALEERIAAGDLDALYEKAWRHRDEGEHVQAEQLFKQAADAGHVNAQRMYGWLLLDEGVKRGLDRETGVDYLQWAAEKEEARACYHLGFCYEKGIGVAKSSEKAYGWYTEGAQLGDARSKAAVARCRLDGIGTPKQERAEVLRNLRNLGKENNADALYQLGLEHQKTDPERAVEYFKQAVHHGNLEARYDLGLCYLEGMGVGVDEEKGLRLIQSVAGGRDPRPSYFWGCCLRDGSYGVQKDEQKAIAYLRRAGIWRNQEAKYALACLWLDRREEQERAERLLLECAKADHLPSQYRLGMHYYYINRRQAYQWLKKAADAGYYPAKEEMKALFPEELQATQAQPEKKKEIRPSDIAKMMMESSFQSSGWVNDHIVTE